MIFAGIFLNSLPARSAVAPTSLPIVTESATVSMINDQMKNELHKIAKTHSQPTISNMAFIPTDVTSAHLLTISRANSNEVINANNELDLVYLAQVQKANDANRMNPADYVPYKNLNDREDGGKVAVKILTQTMQTLASQQPSGSVFNTPVLKTGSYQKTIEDKDFKFSYGLHNSRAETQLKYQENTTATLSIDPASSGVKFEVARKLNTNQTLAYTHNSDGNIIGLRWNF